MSQKRRYSFTTRVIGDRNLKHRFNSCFWTKNWLRFCSVVEQQRCLIWLKFMADALIEVANWPFSISKWKKISFLEIIYFHGPQARYPTHKLFLGTVIDTIQPANHIWEFCVAVYIKEVNIQSPLPTSLSIKSELEYNEIVYNGSK